MASINFLLKDLTSNGFDIKTLENLIPKIGMEIEKYDDNEIVLDITPNRPDMLDFTGFLRAIKAFTGISTTSTGIEYKIENEPFINIYVDEKIKKIRPFIGAVIVKNVNLKENKFQYLINFIEKFTDTFGRKRKKFAIGLYDFNKIKPDLYYTISKNKKFIPLDYNQEMNFNEILSKHDKGIKYKNIIENKTSKNYYPILKDSEKILSLIPIINSEQSKITENTKNLLIDVTGISENAINQALSIISCSFLDQNAKIFPVKIHYKNKIGIAPNLVHKQIKIKTNNINKNIGIKIDEKTALELLQRMGYASKLKQKNILVNIPPYRTDIFDQQDIIEDITIAYGYENIEPKPIIGNFEGSSDPIKEYSEKFSLFMIGLGFSEVINPVLTNEKLNFENMLQQYNKNNVIKIIYSKTEAISIIKTSLIPNLLNNLEVSSNQKMPLKIFEIGSIFYLNEKKINEDLCLSFASEHSKANFAEIKADVSALMKLSNHNNYKLAEEKNNSFIEGRCAAIYINNEKFGIFGEIHPKVLKNFNLDESVVVAELIIKKNIEYEYRI
ncbi:phenylalanine--tRNA ligase subunit beta [Candidatus Marsarchaeota archaeon]|nr:phenylalanine--tRNA ligase subunit beta [Candidatus Marsarchaeota archaeon]